MEKNTGLLNNVLPLIWCQEKQFIFSTFWILNLADVVKIEGHSYVTFLADRENPNLSPRADYLWVAVILTSNQYFMTYKWLVTQETTFYPSTQLNHMFFYTA